MSDLVEVRRDKQAKWEERQGTAFVEKFTKDWSCAEMARFDDGCVYNTAGRVVSKREMGKWNFAHIQDATGQFQIAITVPALGDLAKFYIKNIDIGDHVGVTGEIFTTKAGEKSLLVSDLVLLSKAMRPLPEKFHGLKDDEACARQRDLDIIANKESRNRFAVRHEFIAAVRDILNQRDFIEVETPILHNVKCGAAAKPFVTHHNDLDQNFFLRIAPETYLKRAVACGYDAVYEIGKNFRNEGSDPSHLQEFTMLEFYWAYKNWENTADFTESLLRVAITAAVGGSEFTYGDHVVDYSSEWKRAYYPNLIYQYAGMVLDFNEDLTTLREKYRNRETHKGAEVEFELDQYQTAPSLLDGIFKKYVRPSLIQPTMVTHYPKVLCPLARESEDRPGLLGMWQILMCGWEIAKGYSELVDPALQRGQFISQLNGDDESMDLDEDFLLSMEHGMPPMSGVGVGIDRVVALITNAPNLRDVVLFPTLRNA